MAKRITDHLRAKQEKLNRKRTRKAQVRRRNKAKSPGPSSDIDLVSDRQSSFQFFDEPNFTVIGGVDIKPLPPIPGQIQEITKFQRGVS
jgi:hypothetical protein